MDARGVRGVPKTTTVTQTAIAQASGVVVVASGALPNGHLHHPHAAHCDDHGPMTMA